MKDHIDFNQKASVELGRSGKAKGGVGSQFSPRGEFVVEHWRDGLLLATHTMKNGITTEGKNHAFDSTFDAQSPITVWYMGLIDLTGYTALDATDTYDDIDQAGNDWDEFKDYDYSAVSTNRGVWSPDAASAASISNSTQVVFDITASGTVKGLFICGGGAASSVQGDHAADGTLWATALFDQGDTAVVNADQLKVTYTISA